MKINIFIFFVIINIINSTIIPVPFEFIGGEMIIEIQQSKNKIKCTVDTSIKKNYIPETINYNSNTKRQYEYEDTSLGFFDRLEGKKPAKLYDDWFYINNVELIMKYYVSPQVGKCIISFSKNQVKEESLINILYAKKKISNNGYGIIYDEKNDKKGIIYLGGLPEEEKKGLYTFSFKYSFFNKIFNWNNRWNLNVKNASIKIEGNTFSIGLSYNGYIELEKEEVILVPFKFYNFLYDTIYGFYIKEKACNIENDNLACDCQEIKKIKSFESIHLNVDGLEKIFYTEDSFIKKNNKCYLIFKPHNNDYFIFGKHFWKNYKIEFLNDNQIILYSKYEFNSKKKLITEKTEEI